MACTAANVQTHRRSVASPFTKLHVRAYQTPCYFFTKILRAARLHVRSLVCVCVCVCVFILCVHSVVMCVAWIMDPLCVAGLRQGRTRVALFAGHVTRLCRNARANARGWPRLGEGYRMGIPSFDHHG